MLISIYLRLMQCTHVRHNNMEDRELLQWEYDTKGYAILKQAMPKLLCKEILEKIRHFEYSVGTLSEKQRNSHVCIHELSDAQRDGIDASLCKDMLYIIGDICEYFPEIIQIFIHPSIAHITNILLDTDNPVYHFSNITIKSAHYGPQSGLHRDYPNKYICPMTSHYMRLILCLSEGNKHNGGLGFICGSHRLEDKEALQGLRTQYSYDTLEYPECEQGDIIAVHPKVIHGGMSNRSDKDRYYCVSQWGMPTDDYLYYTEEKFTGISFTELSAMAQ